MEKQGKKAIVIGASSGIGLEVAKLLVGAGWTVGVGARRVERMQQIGAVAERYRPTCVGIETVWFGQNITAAFATGQARGAALVACAQAGMTVGEFSPKQIKLAVVGAGAYLGLYSLNFSDWAQVLKLVPLALILVGCVVNYIHRGVLKSRKRRREQGGDEHHRDKQISQDAAA